ncbi:hypothetical protein PS9374_04466 [Planomonospora sphaerica]|uniref:Uncharacterized protein n=1 Tax=Planomonospora sphaerica TaxID=161355 RepID=A0A171DIU7_9ACTN|nr:hypothetical protein [Planomonospora sphaerica]GAT68801.1 hypothetical protein PS9374_04466 [Planomonospora sphaerica]
MTPFPTPPWALDAQERALLTPAERDVARLREAILCDPGGLAEVASQVNCRHRLPMDGSLGRCDCVPIDGLRLSRAQALEVLDTVRRRVVAAPRLFLSEAGAHVPDALNCTHLYRLSDSCPCCDGVRPWE